MLGPLAITFASTFGHHATNIDGTIFTKPRHLVGSVANSYGSRLLNLGYPTVATLVANALIDI